MKLLPIRRLPDPVLKRPTRQMTRLDRSIHALIDALIATMHHYPRCVGLAAPQAGSSLRVAVMDSSRHPKTIRSQGLIVLINPRIVANEGALIQREGCLSIPDFTGNVRRATEVVVAALDQTGAHRQWRLEGFEAVIAQHEIDHLDGILFLDRVINPATDVFRRTSYG